MESAQNTHDDAQSVANGFRKLIGRSPTNTEIIDLIHIKDALGLRGDDPLWMILYALQHYQSLYKTLPAEIHAAVNRAEAILGDRGLHGSPRASEWRILLWSWRKKTVAIVAVCLVAGLLFGLGRLSVPAPARELSALNGGGQVLLTCFHGGGRIQRQADGKTYCFPVSTDGRAFGYVVSE